MRAASSRLRKDGLSLQHFVLRAEAFKAYRTAVRATRPLPDSATRRETLDFLRADLDKLRHVHEISDIRAVLTGFQRTMKQFLPSIGLSSFPSVGEDDRGLEVKHAKLIGRQQNAQDLLVRRFMA